MAQTSSMTILSFDLQVWPLPSTHLNKCFNAKLFWNPCINVEVMGWTSWIYDNFIIWPSCAILTFNLPEQMFQMALLLLKENWPFYHMTFKCDLDLQPTWTNVSNDTSTRQEEQLCQIFLKSMHKCRSYYQDKSGQTHNTHMHIYQTEILTTMSRSLQAGSTKIDP